MQDAYDVVIIGGAMTGSSAAFWLTRNPDFTGRVLVVERDPTYAWAATTHTNSCIRLQYGSEVNVRISRFAGDFIHQFKEYMQDDAAPDIVLQNFGYLYLADTPAFLDVLRDNAQMQRALGAETQILTPDEIAALFPFYNLDGILGGSFNTKDEGYFDGGTMFDWLRIKARAQGATFLTGTVTAISADNRFTLASGRTISAGHIINAAGTRGAEVAAMAGLRIPIEARRRFTFIAEAARPLPVDLPLTIDPVGVHMRSDGRYYMIGCPPDLDVAVDPDDFTMDHAIWEDHVWPTIAARIPAFEELRLINTWVGHYDYNTLDQNAIIGPHPERRNFLFANGFSGHGLQQAPAVGRALSELVIYDATRTLDLGALGYERIASGTPLRERAII